jgi:hypothetical protein
MMTQMVSMIGMTLMMTTMDYGIISKSIPTTTLMTMHQSIYHKEHLSLQELIVRITMTMVMMLTQMTTVSSKQFGTEEK